jgi:quercetin dioxygenase-like cupin family protein
MALLNKPLLLGNIRGTIYDFELEGDVLPLHNHGHDSVHISIIAKGSFRAFGREFDQTLPTGTVLDWQAGVEHGFEALEPSSRLINIIKHIG